MRIPSIFSQYKRLIYIDSDTVVLTDIAQLFDQDIKNFHVGAVRDYAMLGFRKHGIRSTEEVGSMPAQDYLTDYVGLNSRLRSYFQAGVLVFDVQKMRNSDFNERIDKLISGKKYWFLDQDIL